MTEEHKATQTNDSSHLMKVSSYLDTQNIPL